MIKFHTRPPMQQARTAFALSAADGNTEENQATVPLMAPGNNTARGPRATLFGLSPQTQAIGGVSNPDFTPQTSNVKFKDVAGVDEAKEELVEVVDFLKNPGKYRAFGADIPKGVMLYGPPGTGKTLLAKAVAGEAGVPFIATSGSEFVEKLVGMGASRVRDLFAQAKVQAQQHGACIVFIDEIDAVGRHRGGLNSNDEREQTLNQILSEMNGFDENTNVIVIAATNRLDMLDQALVRSGRFDRKIEVGLPDVAGRKAILKVHAQNKPLASDVDLDLIAQRTPGFAGADLKNLLNEAALLAARRSDFTPPPEPEQPQQQHRDGMRPAQGESVVGAWIKKKLGKGAPAENTQAEERKPPPEPQEQPIITMADCKEAIDRVLMGPQKKSLMMSEKEKLRAAYHEGGHTLVGKLLPDADPITKVTILPRAQALGLTWSVPSEDKHLRTKEELLAEITMCMGGRAAERIALGKISTGASNDIERATQIARQMVTAYGMSHLLGPQTLKKPEAMEDRTYSEDTARKIDMEVKTILKQCAARAEQILQSQRLLLDQIANDLMLKETIEGHELDRIVNAAMENGGKPPDPGKIKWHPAVAQAKGLKPTAPPAKKFVTSRTLAGKLKHWFKREETAERRTA